MLRRGFLFCLLMWGVLGGFAQSIPTEGVNFWTNAKGDSLWVEATVVYSTYWTDEDDLQLEIKLTTSGNPQETVAKKVKRLNASSRKKVRVEQVFKLGDVSPWRPDFPYLYKLQLRLGNLTGPWERIYDSFTDYVGFPRFDADSVALNLVQEDEQYAGYNSQLPIAEIQNRVKMAYRNGYNAICDADHPINTAFVTEAARMGMLYVSRNADAKRKQILKRYPNVLFVSEDELKADPPLQEPSLCMHEAITEAEQAPLPLATHSLIKGVPGMKYLYRVNVGGTSATDSNGQLWEPDSLYLKFADGAEAGQVAPVGYSPMPVAVHLADSLYLLPEADQAILRSYRSFVSPADTLVFPVDSAYNYCIELFVQEPVVNSKMARCFNISLNGYPTLPFDVRRITRRRFVGTKIAYTLELRNEEHIKIAFPKPEAGHPIISCIAISTLY